MRQILKERPWANPEDHSEGANQAVGSEVLQVRWCLGRGRGGGG